jgi:hypoxanthine phosphoribosyltransferase
LSNVKIKLLAALKESANNNEVVEIDALNWKEALIKLLNKYPKLSGVIDSNGEPKPGFIMFVDGIDYRLKNDNEEAKEIYILPVNHGGIEVLILSWDDIEKSVDIVSEKIKNSEYKPDIIISVLRGGVIPGRLLADKLEIDDIGILEIKLYIAAGQKGERPFMRQPLTLPIKDKRVLLVDDVSDSGLTLEFAIQAISLYMPLEIKTATLYMKPWTKLIPDYYAEEVDKWVVFPWERKEFENESKSMPGLVIKNSKL